MSIKAELRTIEPVDSLELIHNGNIVKTVNLKDPSLIPLLKESIVTELRPMRSGWVAARCVFRTPDGRSRQAHTSPTYITVDGKPTAFARDAEYMIRCIDRLLVVSNKLGRYRSDNERSEVQAVCTKARQVYEEILSISRKQ